MSLKKAIEEYSSKEIAVHHVSDETFAAMRDSLSRIFPNKRGIPNAVCETGDPYVEFYANAICRPDPFDIECVKASVRHNIARQLTTYFNDGNGTIYWRIMPEEDLQDHQCVIRYDENGPDKDFYTDKRCFMDKNWKAYSIYMRLVLSAKPELAA